MQPGEIATYVAVRLGAVPPEREDECRAMLQVAPTYPICMEALATVPWLNAEKERKLDATLLVLERGRKALELLEGHPALSFEKVQILQGLHLENAITDQAEIYDLLREHGIDVTPEFIKQVEPLTPTQSHPAFIPPPPDLPEPVPAATGAPPPMDEPGDNKSENTHMLLDRLDGVHPTTIDAPVVDEVERRVPPPPEPEPVAVPVLSEQPQRRVEGVPQPPPSPIPVEHPPAPPPYRPPEPDAATPHWGRTVAAMVVALILGVVTYLAFDAWQRESEFNDMLQAGDKALARGDFPKAFSSLERAARLKPDRGVAARIDNVRQVQQLMAQAEAAFLQNDFKGVISLCTQILALAPGLPRALELNERAQSLKR